MSPEAGPLQHARAIPVHGQVGRLARLVLLQVLLLLVLLLLVLLLLLLQPWRGAWEGQRRALASICRTIIMHSEAFSKCHCTKLTSTASTPLGDGAPAIA